MRDGLVVFRLAAPDLAPAFYFQGLNELEREGGFGGEDYIAVASEASATSARGRADQAADNSAFAATSEASNESASASATADHACGAFTLASASFSGCSGLDVVVLILDGDAGQGEREHRTALESSSGLGVFDETGGASTLGDGEPVIDLNRDLKSGGKCLPGSADPGADSLVEYDRDDRPGWDDERPRRSRKARRGCWRGLFCRRRSGVIRAGRRGGVRRR